MNNILFTFNKINKNVKKIVKCIINNKKNII